MKNRQKSGQSAMEYLMTYGWAILIIIIVAAALFALGVFNPATFTGKRATGFPNIGNPPDWIYTGSTFNVSVKNSLGSPINITAMTAATPSSNCGAVAGSNPSAMPFVLGSGQTATVWFTTCPALTSGTAYSLSVSITYTQQGGTFSVTDTGTLTGTAS
ncbi:MAG: hypothetical protein HY367_04500 [Candidatus Aenigmarchaeota archaeon]|nr:hypothetical protein [Candidatus Aenigmarchaeota archaeon]